MAGALGSLLGLQRLTLSHTRQVRCCLRSTAQNDFGFQLGGGIFDSWHLVERTGQPDQSLEPIATGCKLLIPIPETRSRFINWSPHSHVDPEPFIEAGYYNEHDKMTVGAIHAGYKNEAILGYAHDFNKEWRVQVDFQSGSENSSTIGFTWNITPDFQVNPAIYFPNYHPERILGYLVFTYTFHLWTEDKKKHDQTVPGG